VTKSLQEVKDKYFIMCVIFCFQIIFSYIFLTDRDLLIFCTPCLKKKRQWCSTL